MKHLLMLKQSTLKKVLSFGIPVLILFLLLVQLLLIGVVLNLLISLVEKWFLLRYQILPRLLLLILGWILRESYLLLMKTKPKECRIQNPQLVIWAFRSLLFLMIVL